MGKTHVLFALIILVGGCGQRPSGAVLYRNTSDSAKSVHVNLALGPSAAHNRIGELFATRSDWPAVTDGYRFRDVERYFEYSFDDQAFYEDDGGSFYHGAGAWRTGAHIR